MYIWGKHSNTNPFFIRFKTFFLLWLWVEYELNYDIPLGTERPYWNVNMQFCLLNTCKAIWDLPLPFPSFWYVYIIKDMLRRKKISSSSISIFRILHSCFPILYKMLNQDLKEIYFANMKCLEAHRTQNICI